MDFRCFSSLYFEKSVLINKGMKDQKDLKVEKTAFRSF